MVSAAQLFRTVSRRDHLGFWDDQTLDAKKVADFLGLDRQEIAAVAGVAAASVRFDRKIPLEVRDKLAEIANTIGLVAQCFDEDAVKTSLWFKTGNPLLGDSSPCDLIRRGHSDRLRRFVLAAMAESTTGLAGAPDGPRSSAAGQPLITRHRRSIARLCKQFGVRRLSAFGSLLRNDFDPAKSDIDLVVDFERVRGLSPARQYFDFKSELERVLDRPVDLIELQAMPESRLKRIIQRTQIPVYGKAG